ANATGLSISDLGSYAPAHISKNTQLTPKDVAILAREIITSYPETLQVTKQTSVVLKGANIRLASTNELLPGQAFAYSGNDGFKTGFTDAAGYCFTGTTERQGKRIITVIMGAKTANSRFTETIKLNDYGFQLLAQTK